MAPFPVIEDFDVIKQALDGFGPAYVPIVIDPLAFESSKKAFGDRIVIAVALAAHAADDIVFFENFLIIG